jgi:hypothetical protein
MVVAAVHHWGMLVSLGMLVILGLDLWDMMAPQSSPPEQA